MKKIYLIAAVATMVAACTSEDKLEVQTPDKPVATVEQGAVMFDAYYHRTTTRAGFAGQIDLTQLKKKKAEGGGFGVFAYYTDNNEYDPQRIPNFMYNQAVFWNGEDGSGTNDIWQYEPIKYWPNEYGTSAISDDADKVSYFAYAPYVDVIPSTGKIAGAADEAKWGITGMSRNSATGDPMIKYMVSFDKDKMVDLLWGVCDDPQWRIINNNLQVLNEGVKGLPWLNVERPLEAATQAAATSSKLKFNFKHALSQLNVQIDTYADGDAAATIDAASRVYIRSISFTGFATQGCLNLNNTDANKALWLDYSGTADLNTGEEVTILMSVMGMIFSLASFVGIIMCISEIIVSGTRTVGWASLMTVLLFSSGVMMLMLGMLGEYVWRALDASSNRPPYIIEDIIDTDADNGKSVKEAEQDI